MKKQNAQQPKAQGARLYTLEVIDDKVRKGKYPKVVKRVGKSPPQYADEEE